MKKATGREKRKIRIRKKLAGTNECPRLSVHRGNKNISVQLIDDIKGRTLLGVSTFSPEMRKIAKYGGNMKAASAVGEILAKKAKEKGITKVVFDRSGYLFHGRVKALAEAARKGGLSF